MIKQIKPKYAGNGSVRFWQRINSLKNSKRWETAYMLGSILQNIEHDILQRINRCFEEAEIMRPRKK